MSDYQDPQIEEKHKHFVRPTTKRPPSLFNLSLIVLFLGLVAGFGGYFIADYFRIDDVDYFNLANTPKEIKVKIEQPLTSLAESNQPSIAGIYRPVQTFNAVGEPLFSQSDFLGSATVVTSDGWLLTTDQVIKNTQAKVVLNNKIYDIVDTKLDDFSGAVFIKINETLLAPVNFQLTDSIISGESAFTNIDLPNSYDHAFYFSFLTNSHYAESKYLSSDNIDYYLKLEQNQAGLAAPYFNLDGDLLGISYQVNDENFLIPAEYLKQALKNLLNNTTRVKLGVYYIDMENNGGFVRRGNLVFNPQLSAVEYNSPAYQAGIKVGDQIVAVNNDTILANQTLTSIIQKYRPGDVVIIKALRNEQELDLEVEL